MSETNQFGLSRAIPDDVKRAVRRRCGFCCVHCRAGLFHYDHFGIAFKDARAHDPEKITLLCASTHDAKTRGHLADSTVATWDEKRRTERPASQCIEIDLHATSLPRFELGPFIVLNTRVVLRIAGDNLVEFLPPEADGAPFRLNAKFKAFDGADLVEIHENEWIARTDTWDIETVGPTTTIRRSPSEIALVWRVTPPDTVSVGRIRMAHAHTRIDIDTRQLDMHLADGTRVSFGFGGVREADAAVDVDREGNLVLGRGGRVMLHEARIEQPGMTNERETVGLCFMGYADFFAKGKPRDANHTLRFVEIDDRDRIGRAAPNPAPPLALRSEALLGSMNCAPKLAANASGKRPKVGRNDPCPCGSGQKAKKCHPEWT